MLSTVMENFKTRLSAHELFVHIGQHIVHSPNGNAEVKLECGGGVDRRVAELPSSATKVVIRIHDTTTTTNVEVELKICIAVI